MDSRKSFIDTLVDHRGGGAYAELEERFKELNLAVQTTGKKGSVSITLVVEPTKKSGEVVAVNCDDVIVAKIPTNPKRSTIFFINKDGTLSRQDQRQLEMLEGLKDIDVQARPTLKEIS